MRHISLASRTLGGLLRPQSDLQLRTRRETQRGHLRHVQHDFRRGGPRSSPLALPGYRTPRSRRGLPQKVSSALPTNAMVGLDLVRGPLQPDRRGRAHHGLHLDRDLFHRDHEHSIALSSRPSVASWRRPRLFAFDWREAVSFTTKSNLSISFVEAATVVHLPPTSGQKLRRRHSSARPRLPFGRWKSRRHENLLGGLGLDGEAFAGAAPRMLGGLREQMRHGALELLVFL